MEKNVENPKRGYLAASIAGFITTALLAVMLGLTAAVAWLTQLTGSLVAASLVIGGFFAVIAAIIYRLSIRDAVEQLRTQVETVYDVARAAKSGYEWIAERVLLMLAPRESR
ncbi:hypothetical protein [Alistipes sp.]|uniref:hypothetical protein n=1 Tax=Alistipes sp. TaxID=1872444 RepID=UPI000E802AAA|nr:hypothetical protein [Alistipes sp.]HBX90074.1 hypothetical protein [Alistipes sp.]HCN13367.1 hypothetical protein [Alistipes sp.]